ncbi:hypothetical protein KYN89_03870 [Alteriqipengyuania sp. NZ-12B]|uniref:Uncharacterized protein n=1 Tax=Alteriqipengyuania abyssalis TaxID=2860200 RepID=A0ABS7PB12_9SPHN|nr:hypothetical protein [Alteriqipengyuania abyssalis]MBY8336176.1 hypothetical protein [Alteriqipengyuania abyssalis]
MRKLICTIAAISLCAGTAAFASQSETRPGEAGAALAEGENKMASEGDILEDRSYDLAKDWGKPTAEGKTGEIFSQMRVNHAFGRHLSTGGFRQDVLFGLDSKANLKVAILDAGIGDSCENLAEDTFAVTLASRAGSLTLDSATTRKFTAGEKSGCFVQIVGNWSALRDFLNQSGDLPVLVRLNVSGKDYPVFASFPGTKKLFWQPASLMKLRQNFAVTGG